MIMEINVASLPFVAFAAVIVFATLLQVLINSPHY